MRIADGDGAGRVPALHALHAPQPEKCKMVRPRSFRAVGRPRLDAALQHSLSHRLRHLARRHQAVPPDRQQDSGPSRALVRPRRRDHYRPARPGRRQRGRHGDGGEASRGALRSRQVGPVRSSHLRNLQRRRPDGRRRERGRIDRRPSRARQHHFSLRRQSRDHRRAHRAQLRRGCGQALRGLQVAYAGCRRRQRPRRVVEGDRKRNRGNQPPVADSGAFDHRLRQSAQAGHARPRTAIRSASKRSS